MSLFTANALWHLVAQSDAMTTIVLVTLLGMSVMCWAVFLCKALLLHMKSKQCAQVFDTIHEVMSVNELVAVALSHKDTLPGYFLSKNLAFLHRILNNKDSSDILLHATHKDMLLQYIDHTLDTTLDYEKTYVSILSTCAGVAPLLGLFGTVWGLIHAFLMIAQTQVADISTVAPGIAQALITTLAGLMVAIPALLMFNYLQIQLRALETALYSLADHMAIVVHHLTLARTHDAHGQNETISS